jgi:hypothetical protein
MQRSMEFSHPHLPPLLSLLGRPRAALTTKDYLTMTTDGRQRRWPPITN